MHGDLTQRAAVITDALAWMARGGSEDKLLEATGDRRTWLVRLPAGGALPITGVPGAAGSLDVLVLDGALREGANVYAAGTYLHEWAPAVQLVTDTGCIAFVKLRPTQLAMRAVVETPRAAFSPADANGVATARLYEDSTGRVALLRFDRGAAIPTHRHDLGEEFFVLDGELDDELGRYPARNWVRQPPGSRHAVRSAGGALALVFADHLAAHANIPAAGSLFADTMQLDGVLSQGPRCTVFAATQLAGRARVAIKLLTSGFRDAAVVQRFLVEASTLGKLQSTHVAKLLDVGALPDQRPYAVMELLDGAPATGPLPVARAVDVAVQACDALAAAHALRIVHRDVRPANLFVTRDGTLKLLSFALALQLPARPTTNAPILVGTPAYMSPEQIVGSRDLDARADLWSLGVSLYELIAGQLPFRGATLQQTAAAVTSSAPPPLPGVTPALAAVIDRCLAKERDRRYASARELAAALTASASSG
nr:cupin domain-containing protein [Kofleriaceae bacterium]